MAALLWVSINWQNALFMILYIDNQLRIWLHFKTIHSQVGNKKREEIMGKVIQMDRNNFSPRLSQSKPLHQHSTRDHAYFYETRYHIYHLGAMHWEKKVQEIERQQHEAMMNDVAGIFNDL